MQIRMTVAGVAPSLDGWESGVAEFFAQIPAHKQRLGMLVLRVLGQSYGAALVGVPMRLFYLPLLLEQQTHFPK